MNTIKMCMLLVAFGLWQSAVTATELSLNLPDFEQVIEQPDGSSTTLGELLGDEIVLSIIEEGCGEGFAISICIAYDLTYGYETVEGAEVHWFDSEDVEDSESDVTPPLLTNSSGQQSIAFWLWEDEDYVVKATVDSTLYSGTALHIGGEVIIVWVDCTP